MNIKGVYITPSEFLIYKPKSAGIFKDYQSDLTIGAATIHREENRRLNEEEVLDLLDEFLSVDDDCVEERSPNVEETKIMRDILHYHPEIKYIVESFTVTAQEPQESPNLEQSIREAEEQRRKETEKAAQQLKEFGKGEGKKKYGGFKGLLFDAFKGLFSGDEEAKKSKEYTRKIWKDYKKNEEILKRDQDLTDHLRDSVEKGKITPDGIAVFVELLSRDPSFLKEIDFDKATNPTLMLYLQKIFAKEQLQRWEQDIKDILEKGSFKPENKEEENEIREEKLTEAVLDNLKEKLQNIPDLDLKKILESVKILGIEKGLSEAEIDFDITLNEALKIMKALDIETDDLNKKLY